MTSVTEAQGVAVFPNPNTVVAKQVEVKYIAKFYTNGKFDSVMQSNRTFSDFKEYDYTVPKSMPTNYTIIERYEQGYRPDNKFDTQVQTKNGIEFTREYHRTLYLIRVKKDDRTIGGAIGAYFVSPHYYVVFPEKLFSRLGYEKIAHTEGKYDLIVKDRAENSQITHYDDHNCYITETDERVHLKNVSLYGDTITKLKEEFLVTIDDLEANAKTITINLPRNSTLVTSNLILPEDTFSAERSSTIQKITPHHMAGNGTLSGCSSGWINLWNNNQKKASSNYGIDSNGGVGLYVEENRMAYTSSNANNDNQAVTIEVANTQEAANMGDVKGNNWEVSDTAYNKLVDLCVDICKRNGIIKLNYTGDSTGNLTRHNMFSATTCPGPYLQGKFSSIKAIVNKRLKLYRNYFY